MKTEILPGYPKPDHRCEVTRYYRGSEATPYQVEVRHYHWDQIMGEYLVSSNTAAKDLLAAIWGKVHNGEEYNVGD